MRTEGKGWARGSSRRGSGAAVGGARCGPVRRPSDNFKRCGRRGKLLPAADLEVVGGVETAAAASDRGSCVGRGGGARDGTSRDDREGDSVSGRGMRNTVSSDNISKREAGVVQIGSATPPLDRSSSDGALSFTLLLISLLRHRCRTLNSSKSTELACRTVH
jgi:hypothetical protein